MIVISKPRGEGKTVEAIRAAQETGACLVVRDASTAQRLAAELHELFIITYSELLSGCHKASGHEKVVIDDLDCFTAFVAANAGFSKVEVATIYGPLYTWATDQ